MTFIKIYFGEKPVYLCDALNDEIDEIRHHPDAIYIDELSGSAIKSLFHEINKPEFHAGIIHHHDFEKLKSTFFKFFKIIQTGGGVIEDNTGRILLIFRRGKWDLPKGKLNKNETVEQCAVREVMEETGLQSVQLLSFMTMSYHTYKEFGKHILKESYWYRMKADESEQLVPQTEEDITEIRWVEKNDLEKYYSNSFETIRSILEAL